MAQEGQEQSVRRAAEELGLHVIRDLGLVHGFAATGPASAVERLRTVAGVVSVTPDRPVRPTAIDPSLGYDPADLGSSSSITQIVGAQDAWVKGWTGAGVDVAVIDTGVTPVAGLDATGKVITGPDLSFDAPSSTTPGLDNFGHGTFMAGLIAGKDPVDTTSKKCPTCRNSSRLSDTRIYTGVAPDARIVNVKVGASDGAADVSQVIAAIDWVVQHARDPGINIRVLNLSFGADSTQSYVLDPLAFAAEQAWKRGIVVVSSAGNEGKSQWQLASPAYDPYLLAVGGLDSHGTLATNDDSVAEFAQNGTVLRPVDVVAPAVSTIGLRAPGSYVDNLTTNVGRVGTRFQRGSGTSQAAAIVSGMTALLVQKYPRATPDQLKALLTSTASPLRPVVVTAQIEQEAKDLGLTVEQYVDFLNWLNRTYGGYGIPSASAALAQAPSSLAKQLYLPSVGGGSLEATRGGVHVISSQGDPLVGEYDILGQPFVAATMATAEASATAWTGGMWNGSRWSGDTWSGSRWSTATWTGTDWSGSRWSGSRWSGSRWSGAEWSGSRWSSAGWQ
jgi:serine protease AprX